MKPHRPKAEAPRSTRLREAVFGSALSALVASVLFLPWPAGHAEDWPQFRGGNASGVSSSKGLPLEFSAESKVAWRAKLGDGIGSPAVMKGRVFTTAMVGEQKAAVFGFDAANGSQLWRVRA